MVRAATAHRRRTPTASSPEGQGGAPYSAIDALGYGWRKFFASPGTLLIPILVVGVALLVFSVIIELLIGATLLGNHDCTRTVTNGATTIRLTGECGPNLFVRLLGAAIASAIVVAVVQVLTAGLYKGATHVTDGKPFSVGQIFDGWDKAQVAIAALIIAAATFVGTLLCYLPGLIVGFLTGYTLLFIVDKQMTAVDAIKASVSSCGATSATRSCSGSWAFSRWPSARSSASSACWSPRRWC